MLYFNLDESETATQLYSINIKIPLKITQTKTEFTCAVVVLATTSHWMTQFRQLSLSFGHNFDKPLHRSASAVHKTKESSLSLYFFLEIRRLTLKKTWERLFFGLLCQCFWRFKSCNKVLCHFETDELYVYHRLVSDASIISWSFTSRKIIISCNRSSFLP